MTTETCLNVLTQLAIDIGYLARTQTLHGIGAKTTDIAGKRVLLINDSASVEERLRSVARCLQNDPQLAWFDLDANQELALQTGSSLVIGTAQVISIRTENDETADWPEMSKRRRAS